MAIPLAWVRVERSSHPGTNYMQVIDANIQETDFPGSEPRPYRVDVLPVSDMRPFGAIAWLPNLAFQAIQNTSCRNRFRKKSLGQGEEYCLRICR